MNPIPLNLRHILLGQVSHVFVALRSSSWYFILWKFTFHERNTKCGPSRQHHSPGQLMHCYWPLVLRWRSAACSTCQPYNAWPLYRGLTVECAFCTMSYLFHLRIYQKAHRRYADVGCRHRPTSATCEMKYVEYHPDVQGLFLTSTGSVLPRGLWHIE